MDRIFGADSKLYAVLSAFTDIVIINVLFLLTAWPVITVGAASRAALVVVKQMLRDECSTPVRTYLREFRKNWRTPTLWWAVSALVTLFAAYEMYVISRAQLGAAGVVATAGVVSGLLIVWGIGVWVYALCAWGEHKQPFKATVLHAVVLAFQQLPRTAGAVLAIGVMPLAVYFFPGHLGAIVTYFVIVGSALSFYLAAIAMAPVLDATGAAEGV